MNLKLFDRVYYKDGKNLIYLGKIALLDACGYTLLCGYKGGWKLEERPIKSIIEQLNKNNTYFKDERYYFVDIKNDYFVIKQRNFFLKNE